jgi:hypothetical protein
MQRENREGRPAGGSGLPQRPPSEWERRPLLPDMKKEPDQGAMKESRPTARSLNPAPGQIGSGSRDYSRSQILGRAGVVAQQRAQGVVSGPVETSLKMGVDQGMAEQIGVCSQVPTPDGGPGNTESNDQGTRRKAEGSATKVTGRPIEGKTMAKGTI